MKGVLILGVSYPRVQKLILVELVDIGTSLSCRRSG